MFNFFSFQEMQIKATRRSHFVSIRMDEIKNATNLQAGVVAHTSNPGTWEAETERSQVQGQLCLNQSNFQASLGYRLRPYLKMIMIMLIMSMRRRGRTGGGEVGDCRDGSMLKSSHYSPKGLESCTRLKTTCNSSSRQESATVRFCGHLLVLLFVFYSFGLVAFPGEGDGAAIQLPNKSHEESYSYLYMSSIILVCFKLAFLSLKTFFLIYLLPFLYFCTIFFFFFTPLLVPSFLAP